VVLTIGTGVGRASCSTAGCCAPAAGPGPSLGTWSSTRTVRAAGADVPIAAASRRSSPASDRQGGAPRCEGDPSSTIERLLSAGRELNGREVILIARSGDGVAEQVVQRAAARLGVALTSYANTFAPEAFVIGGGVAAAGEMLFEPARREYWSRGLRPLRLARVTRAQLGVSAGMVGAAIMVIDELARPRNRGSLLPNRPELGPVCEEARPLEHMRSIVVAVNCKAAPSDRIKQLNVPAVRGPDRLKPPPVTRALYVSSPPFHPGSMHSPL
jgi:hypothetical protein